MEINVLSQEATASDISLNTPEYLETKIHSNNKKDPECVSCHLCAIEVPRRFINEHYKSDKHNINKKIASVALERVQKSLQCNFVSHIDTTESLYFCPQCLISLNPKDRQSHEKTIVHKKALTVDKFLYDFYVLYANDDVNSDIAMECKPIVTIESNNIKRNNEIDNIDEKLLTKTSEKIEVTTDHNIGITNKNIVKSDPVENDDLNMIKVEKPANNYIKNEVNNSSPFFNSSFCISERNRKQVYCKTCTVYVPNSASNLMSHQKGLKHKMLEKTNNN